MDELTRLQGNEEWMLKNDAHTLYPVASYRLGSARKGIEYLFARAAIIAVEKWNAQRMDGPVPDAGGAQG